MRRPSYYVLLCAVLVLTTFSASGHLRIGAPNVARPTAPAGGKLAAPPPKAPTAQLTGSVLDTMGFLLAGAEVAAGAARTRTDADGRFAFDVPRTERLDVRLFANGHRACWLPVSPLAAEALVAALEPAAPWDLAEAVPAASTAPPLVGEGFVRGVDGRPLEGALVFVAETMAAARTDRAGRYEIALPPTVATLVVHHADGGVGDRGASARAEPFTAPRRSGRVPLPELAAGPALLLRGTVRDVAGQPQKGVPIQVVGNGVARTIATGDGGIYRLGGLLPGRHELRVFAFRGALGTVDHVDLQAPTTDRELQMRRPTERRLRIVTERGEPVPRAMLVTTVDGLRRDVVRSDDGGFVQVRAAEPAAAFDVRTGADYRPMRVLAAPDGEDHLVVAAQD